MKINTFGVFLLSLFAAGYILLTLKALTLLPSFRAGIFREFGGARCVHNIVKYPQCRQHALMIIQQLVLSPSGEDDMGTLLGLMHSAPPTELQLKTDILRVGEGLLLSTLAPEVWVQERKHGERQRHWMELDCMGGVYLLYVDCLWS